MYLNDKLEVLVLEIIMPKVNVCELNLMFLRC